MLGASRRVRRLEKETILRAKDREYTREQSNNYLSKLNINVDEDEDTERHRRHITTRPIRQIQREVDYPVETLDKITERIQQEVKRRQMASSSSTTTPTATSSTTRNYRTSLSTTDDRNNYDTGVRGKYTSSATTNSTTTSKYSSGTKLY